MISKYKGEWLLVLATLSAALGWIFSKNALAELPPLAFNSLRFIFAGLIFVPFAYKQIKNLNKEQWLLSFKVGLSLVGYLTFYILALKVSTQIGKGAFILSLSMLAAPLLGFVIFKNKIGSDFFIAIVPAILGMYFLSSNAALALDLDVLLFLITAVFAAIQYVLNNHYARKVPALALTTISLLMVGISHAFGSLVFEPVNYVFNSSSIMWLALSVLIGTSARFLLQTLGQKYSEITTGAVIMILEPVWTLILSMAFLGESLNPKKLIGCSLILLALILFRGSSLIKKLFARKANSCKAC